MNRTLLRKELIRDEGLRLTAYQDTAGLWTIGVGHLLGNEPRMTRITVSESMALLNWDISDAIKVVESLVPESLYWWEDRGQGGHGDLEEARHRALVNMAFNLGNRLAGFKQFLAAVNRQDYATAADEMLDSKWATQVGDRAQRLADMIRTGKDA